MRTASTRDAYPRCGLYGLCGRDPFHVEAHAILAGSAQGSRAELSLHAREHIVVLGVWTDPEPDHRVVLSDAQRPVISAYANRVNRLRSAHAFEIQTWVVRILDKPPIRLSRPVLDGCR